MAFWITNIRQVDKDFEINFAAPEDNITPNMKECAKQLEKLIESKKLTIEEAHYSNRGETAIFRLFFKGSA